MKFRNSTDALVGVLESLLSSEDEVRVRGTVTKEALGQAIELEHPLERVYLLPHRNDNIFAKIAETLWMLAGRNDIEWLKHYLPRAPEFSDNGLIWRGGYGPRLRKWGIRNYTRVDQIKYVLDALYKDIYTRQAIISIWDPLVDTKPGKDIPCNNWIQFIVRDGESSSKRVVHMHVTQRSCDAIWGYSGIDTFSWSILHEMVAYWIDARVGTFRHFIGSLHVYDRHWDRAQKIVGDYHGHMYDGVSPIPIRVGFDELDVWLNDILNIENEFRYNPDQSLWDDIHERYEDDFLASCAKMLYIYACRKSRYAPETIAHYIREMRPNTDFRMAAMVYMAHHYDKDGADPIRFYNDCGITTVEAATLLSIGMNHEGRT
jgi:thymidylate synthase